LAPAVVVFQQPRPPLPRSRLRALRCQAARCASARGAMSFTALRPAGAATRGAGGAWPRLARWAAAALAPGAAAMGLPAGFALVGDGTCCAAEGCSGRKYSSDGPTFTSDNGVQCGGHALSGCDNRTIFDICDAMPDCLAVTITGDLNNFWDCELHLASSQACDKNCEPGDYPMCGKDPSPLGECGSWYGDCHSPVKGVKAYQYSSGPATDSYSKQACFRKEARDLPPTLEAATPPKVEAVTPTHFESVAQCCCYSCSAGGCDAHMQTGCSSCDPMGCYGVEQRGPWGCNSGTVGYQEGLPLGSTTCVV